MTYMRLISFDYPNAVNMIWLKHDLLHGESMNGMKEAEARFNKRKLSSRNLISTRK